MNMSCGISESAYLQRDRKMQWNVPFSRVNPHNIWTPKGVETKTTSNLGICLRNVHAKFGDSPFPRFNVSGPTNGFLSQIYFYTQPRPFYKGHDNTMKRVEAMKMIIHVGISKYAYFQIVLKIVWNFHFWGKFPQKMWVHSEVVRKTTSNLDTFIRNVPDEFGDSPFPRFHVGVSKRNKMKRAILEVNFPYNSNP